MRLLYRSPFFHLSWGLGPRRELQGAPGISLVAPPLTCVPKRSRKPLNWVLDDPMPSAVFRSCQRCSHVAIGFQDPERPGVRWDLKVLWLAALVSWRQIGSKCWRGRSIGCARIRHVTGKRFALRKPAKRSTCDSRRETAISNPSPSSLAAVVARYRAGVAVGFI
jgi:hypothetical protein